MNFQLSETSAEKILSILKGLNPSKGDAIDNLSRNFLNNAAHVLAQPISPLNNLSINFLLKVKPLFKKGSKTNSQNYCPISLLSLLSKIIERIVRDQTEEFLSKNKLLYRFKSSF